MRRYTLFILAFWAFASAWAQNKELDLLIFKYRNNPSVEYQNSKDSIPSETGIKVLETLDFGEATSLIQPFFSEYEQIKGFKKLKATKVLKIKGNLFKKFLLNKLFDIRVWESENGYKDMVIEFDGCTYIIMHIGGFYKEKELAQHIKITSLQ